MSGSEIMIGINRDEIFFSEEQPRAHFVATKGKKKFCKSKK
jgi:hypothetical protein